MENLGLGKYQELFAENEIDLEVLPELTEQDLKDLDIPLGPRKKLLKAISSLSADNPLIAIAEPTSSASQAERRQLTVMFVDLVGSTALSRQLDPEDLRALILAYQNTVAGEISRYEGYIARYMGDGVLAYFGWPRAHEDEAERAVRAGLEVIEAVAKLHTPSDEALAARVGIASGLVVVGDVIGEGTAQEEAVVGETPNLAARLQALAPPNGLLVGALTRQLAGAGFDYLDFGEHTLKGFSEPVQAWQVVRVKQGTSRFEAAQTNGTLPLIGREHELGLLLVRWRQAVAGEGQVLLLTGEAGIGKSRLAQALHEQLADQPHTRLRLQCSPYFKQSPYYPIIEQVQRAAGFARTDDTGTRLDKLEAMLAEAVTHIDDLAPLFAALLSIPNQRYPALDLAPQQLKEKILGALEEYLVGLSAKRPVLLLFEDIHWLDPSSLELLNRLLERVPTLPVLLLLSCRPEFNLPWRLEAPVTTLSLNRLSQQTTVVLLDCLTGGKALPSQIQQQIIDKTDGIPLFIEELSKTVLESGFLKETKDRYALNGPLPTLAVPNTLQDSLMARLDRLSVVKEVAQLGAVLGREFSFELLAAVAPMSETTLHTALAQLTQDGLLYRRGAPPAATYLFKHALVQDAAYESLLKSKRQHLHGRIAAVLEQRFAEDAATRPELLAQHYTAAGLQQQAVPYWQQAAERAVARSADAEAVVQAEQGLVLLASCPEMPDRDAQELALRIPFGTALINTKGTASVEVEENYRRARELCRIVNRPEQDFIAAWGLWIHYHLRGRSELSQGMARELIELSSKLDDSSFQLQAHHAAWTIYYTVGDFAKAKEHAEHGRRLYDPRQHRGHGFVYGGHDPGVCAGINMAYALWHLGYPKRAMVCAQEAQTLAKQIDHPNSVTLAQKANAELLQFSGDTQGALAQLDDMLVYSTEHDLPVWVRNSKIMRGWVLAARDQDRAAVETMRQAIAARKAEGARLSQCFYHAILAEALGWTGQAEQGLEAIAEALELMEAVGELRWEALIYCIRGDLMLAAAHGDARLAEACFQQALRVAQKRNDKSFELRAALGLARLWREQGEIAHARDLLTPIYDWFTEGFDTADLKDARELLDESA